MNMIKNNGTYKSRLSLFGAAVLAVMLFVSCNNMFQTKKENQSLDSQLLDSEMGIITVKINNGNARTVLPSPDDFKVENLTNIKLEGLWGDETTPRTIISECATWSDFQSVSTTAVQTGNWIFTLTAKLGNVTFTGTQGTSTEPVTIVKNTATNLEFTLTTTTTYGGLSLGITMTSGDATMIAATLKTSRTGGTVVDEQTLTLSGSTTTYAISIDGTTSNNEKLTAGTYYLELAFKANDTLPVLNTWKGIVRIEKGITTTSSITWSTDEVYEIQLTDNGGVLSGGGSVTPISFTRKSSKITLPQMTKAGYYFEGWYKDSGFTANKKIEKIETGTTGNQPVYARFINTLYVSNGGLTAADGTRDTAALDTIDHAVNKIIGFATSGVQWNINVSGQISFDESQTVSASLTTAHASKLSIQGTTGTDTDILNGNESVTTLKIMTAVPVTISNLKITGGSDLIVNDADETSGKGGGLYVSGASDVTLSGVSICGNKAAYGGGIYAATGSTILIEDTLINQNEAHPETTNFKNGSGCGGGIYVDEASITLGEKTVISENTAIKSNDYRLSNSGYAGGVYCKTPASFTIVEADQSDDAVKFLSNNGEKNGGGIYYDSTTLTLEIPAKTVFKENTSTYGGAIFVGYQAEVTFSSGIKIEKNTATLQGGAVYNRGTLNLDGCTIGGTTEDTRNTADQGGAIYNYCSTSTSVTSGIVNIKSNTVSIPCNEVKKNDVFIPTTNKAESAPLTIAADLSGNGAIACLTVQDWKRGAAILNAVAGHTITSAEKQKFTLTSVSSELSMEELFDKYIIHGEEGNVDQVKIDASIYVSATGSDGNDENPRYGTSGDPFATFSKALAAVAPGMDVDIVVDGEIILPTGDSDVGVNISFSTGMAPTKLTVRGKNGNNATDIINRNLTDENSLQSRYRTNGICVVVNSGCPVTFKNIRITGGNNSETGFQNGTKIQNMGLYEQYACGGLLVMKGADVTLETGTLITGNKCCYCGGGVLVYGDTSETGKLTIKEGAEISDNWANHTDSNSWEIGGGGIYNRGIVIMEGGEIKNNKSSYTAGGVFNRGQFDMSGGTISGNSLTNNNSGSTDGLYIYNNTAMAVCSISLSDSASIPKNNVSPQNGIYLYGTPSPVINLKGPLSNSNFYLPNAPTGNVIYNQAEMARSDFVTQVAKFSLSSGSLTVDEEGTYAVKQ